MSIPRKLKPCIDCGSPSYIFSRGRCKNCWQLSKLREGPKEQVKLVQTDSKPAKPFKVGDVFVENKPKHYNDGYYKKQFRITAIKKVSDKRAKLNTAYNALSTVFKKEHPICQAKVVCKGAPTTDTHHKRGRGEYLLDSRYYLAVCRACHNWIGDNHAAAMELGLVESRLSK